MDERLISRLMSPMARAVGNMLARGTLVLANAASKMQTLQVRILDGEAKDAVEHFEPYGYTSCPHPGAEALLQFPGGDRSHGVAFMVADRRYRLAGLAAGEVALYDDQGSKIVLKRGNVIEVTAATKVRMITPLLEVTGEIKDRCDSDGMTLDAMRNTYNSHTHPGDSGGTTGTPNQGM